MNTFHEKPNKYVTEVVLRIKNLERSLEFYKDIMGLTVLDKKKDRALLSIDGLTPVLTLIQPRNIIEKIPKKTGLYHFAVLLPSRYNLGLFLKHIKEVDYLLIGGSNHGVSEAIYLQDPDGNGIEVYADIDSAKWTWEDNEVKMITAPLDYDGLLYKTGENKWKGMPIGAILGHIHLHVSDLNKARKFYVDGLGFDAVMKLEDSALFLSSGGYHHHIGLNTWNGTDAEPQPEKAVGMEYYTIMLPDSEAKKDVISRLKELGYQITEKEDDVYTKDPSGNIIKLMV